MKYRIFAAPVLSITILTSCGQNEAGGGRIETTQAPQFTIPSATPANNSVASGTNSAAPIIPGGKLNPAHGQPGHRCDIAVGAPLPATASSPALPILNNPAAPQNTSATSIPAVQTQPVATTTTAKGMNPAHGQPGHRCDIPVGQPLSSAPAKPQTTTTTTPSVITPKVDNTPDTMFAKGLNPAHGKPGHRCDIAVGQPLTSAAKKDTATSKAN